MALSTDSTVKFDAFADEHESLERALSGLRVLLEKRQDARAAMETLAELSEHVLAHFVHEEQEEGFFDNVVEQAPRLKCRAVALIQEHVDMAEGLADMQSYGAKNVPSAEWWSGLNTRFEAFRSAFCRHERAEIDMVQEAFQADIGAGD